MKFVDLHSHILPGIDDGAKNAEIAALMANACLQQGIDTIVCTPHYYHSRKNSVASFIEKREESLELLKNELTKRNKPSPEFFLGAEVLFDCELTEIQDIEKLAFSGTNYILIEMPYTPWQTWMFEYIYDLIALKNLTPVIAHIERYEQSPEMIEQLAGMEVCFQINADSVLGGPCKSRAHKLLDEGLVQIIATDTHNMNSRPPKMSEAFKAIEQKYSEKYSAHLIENSRRIIQNLEIEKAELEYYAHKTKKRFFGRFFR